MLKWLFALLLLPGICFANETTLALAPQVLRQGECLSITLPAQSGISKAEGLFLGRKFRFFGSRGLVGVPAGTKPGTYPLNIVIGGDKGSFQVNRKVNVSSANFPTVHLWLKPAKKKLLQAKDLVNEEWGMIEQKLLIESPRKKWVGKFQLPVTAPVSMYFGTREFVNKKKRGQHTGLDLAASEGTTVEAANNGTVVFAQPLKVFGGTIVVDHGQGVFSLYFHLSKLLVNVGQAVTKGDKIALSGNAGVSSGAHLHWGMSVHNLRVNPMQWAKTAL